MDFKYLKKVFDDNDEISSFYYLEGDKNADVRIMFIGNSITIHELKPEIGWNKQCGMAASDINHDYVHIVYKYLLNKYKSVSICVCNAKEWELDYPNKSKADLIISLIEKYQPHILVLRIGENFKRDYLNQSNPYNAFDYIIKNAKKVANKVIVTSLFWEWDNLDATIKKVSYDNNVKYVYLTDLSKDKTNEAIGQFENRDVSLHPNDKGMKEIANRILGALEDYEI